LNGVPDLHLAGSAASAHACLPFRSFNTLLALPLLFFALLMFQANQINNDELFLQSAGP